MHEENLEKKNRKEKTSGDQSRSNTLTMLFYVLGMFAVFAIGFIVIMIRSRG